MKITNRFFVFVFLCLLAILPAYPQTPNQKFLVFVGTYTEKTDSKGIYAYEFDASTGKLAPKGLAAGSSNPSWLAIHPNGKWAYAANESGKQSSISAFSTDAKSAKLTLLNQLPAFGEDPCYLSFDKTGKYLFVANYTSGNVVVFPILPDGKLGEHTSSMQDGGVLGPNKERQEAPHAHWIEPSIDGHGVYVADLGLDRLLTYRFDTSNGTLNGAPLSSYTRYKNAWSVPVNPGDGPRHAVFGANDHIYVLGEVQSAVTGIVLDYHTDIEPVQRISTIPTDYKGRNDAAEIALHPSGKWLFTSNRGHDSITVFSVDPATGKLELAGDYSTGGKEPRHFALDPTGKFLLAENQNSNSIVVFRINPESGALSQISITEGIPSPVCLTFLRTP
ncbi:MAG TPA: lactonase family protein [Candidatus Limnocylindrales bacterium]|nr:lactonase family protein [Candidatus Limnocylindrales bacterium]